MTITIQVITDDHQSAILDTARDAFPDATSICVESYDGTSETIYTRKEK